MQLSEFSYSLPKELIAVFPTAERTNSKLLILDKKTGAIKHQHFFSIANYINPGDLLIFNDSKVIAARLYGHKSTGGKIEILIERILKNQTALCHIKSNKALHIPQEIFLDECNIKIKVTAKKDNLFLVEFVTEKLILDILDLYGHVPLPPYIARCDMLLDKQRYQTVYAKELGSVAAPTAGLHFDKKVLNTIKTKGADLAYITLHVGAGTFQPVKTQNIFEHKMHNELITVDADVCAKISKAKQDGKRVIAVGTTTVRALETAALYGNLMPYSGETNIFIYPGFKFNVVDAMITNFHLPESTLLMLVCAFAGRDFILNAYKTAIENHYRFFSYGDAMLII